ncbi:MAG: Nramp family divalent metal transporter [Planctomycetales bacterium]|nr:Nramp family divalent metal transporter [Planctomycetales bacterium]
MAIDPYVLTDESVLEPPQTFFETLKYIGPGFILSASIVGSGELIATTIVGAKAGFILLWFIIFSCLVKVVVQLEFGKHAISSGESTMASLNTLPGPRLGSANWSIWTWLLLMSLKMLQVGGVLGGVVLAVHYAWPMQSTVYVLCTYAIGISVSLFVFRGYYQLIEKACLIMIAMFTALTAASLLSLQFTDLAIHGSELWQGFLPSIPADRALILVAIGAFGITGVGGDEIMAYNYWLIEKGYAAYTGRKADGPDWERRAKGWIKVMYWDAILAMLAYTAVTAMFYLLGAAVLNRNGLVPDGGKLISTLSEMYTQSLGPWAKYAFIVGALVVLYSTLLAALAAWSRLFADAFGRIGLYRFENQSQRNRYIAVLAWLIPAIWATLFLSTGDPAWMVILGGIATTVILVIVVFAALYFRYRRLDARLRPHTLYDITLWISAIAILCVAIRLAQETGQKVLDSLNSATATTSPSGPSGAGNSQDDSA